MGLLRIVGDLAAADHFLDDREQGLRFLVNHDGLLLKFLLLVHLLKCLLGSHLNFSLLWPEYGILNPTPIASYLGPAH